MISNTFIFIFGTVVFGTWLIASFIEFRKMANNPKKYRSKKANPLEGDKLE